MSKLCSLVLAAFIAASPSQAGEIGGLVKLAGNLTVVEASRSVKGLSFYGFADIFYHGEKLDEVYAESRVTHELCNGISAAVEYNGGNRTDDTLRAGFTFVPETGKKNFTLFKVYPLESSAKKGAQASIYSEQDMGRLTTSVLLDYNVDPSTLYTELELRYAVKDNLDLMVQGRGLQRLKERRFEMGLYFGGVARF